MALHVLSIARLLADEQQLRVRRPFSEDGLRCVPPERAGTALPSLGAYGRE
jgi:hypothetical protein